MPSDGPGCRRSSHSSDPFAFTVIRKPRYYFTFIAPLLKLALFLNIIIKNQTKIN